jgi:quinoprotein glucose dehydrogenase
MRPSVIGGANWGGGAFDPDTGILYVKTSSSFSLARVTKPADSRNPRSAAITSAYTQDFQAGTSFHNGLPLSKPPYGFLNAVDLNKAEIVWQVPFGDNAAVRNHPALKDISLPPQLGVGGAQGGIVTKGGLIFIGGGDQAFHAVDKATGKDLWTFPLGRRTTSTPATYRTKSGKQFVVIAVTGQGQTGDSSVVAFALP